MQLKVIHIIDVPSGPESEREIRQLLELATAESQFDLVPEIWKTNGGGQLISLTSSSTGVSASDVISSENGITVFHLHGHPGKELKDIAALLTEKNISYLYSPSETDDTSSPELTENKAFLLSHARHIHVRSKTIAGALQGAKEVLHIPYGQNPLPAENHGFDLPETPRFGFHGKLDIHNSGLDLLLTAFRDYLQLHGNNAELHIIGSGPDKDRLMQHCLLMGIHTKVLFSTPGSDEEHYTLMRSFMALILPSRSEAPSEIITEAMALGTPCIISRATGFGEIINSSGTGLELPENDAAHILQSMLQVASWDQQTRESIWVRSLYTLSSYFSWNKTAGSMKEIYAELMR